MRFEVQRAKCSTCPFRQGSPYANLANGLAQSALTTASRYCHSTGVNALNGNTRKRIKICRGARDLQLQLFYRLGFLSEQTDEAWEAKCKEMRI
jgi:hypothetical protein